MAHKVEICVYVDDDGRAIGYLYIPVMTDAEVAKGIAGCETTCGWRPSLSALLGEIAEKLKKVDAEPKDACTCAQSVGPGFVQRANCPVHIPI